MKTIVKSVPILIAVAVKVETDGHNDSQGIPHLQDPSNNDFRLTSNSDTLIDSGADMGTGYIATVNIQGTDYKIPWDFALGPKTFFHATNPDKIVIDQLSRDKIGWDKGAYGYVEDEHSSVAKVRNVSLQANTN